MATLDGKTALVTGASRGIGRAIATRLASEGAEVAVHFAKNEAAATEVVETIKQKGGSAYAIRAEFGTDGDVDTLFEQLDDTLAGRPLDILVNNAGILDGSPFGTVPIAAFDRSYAINVRAPFFVIQGALPRLPDGGRIVNISSAVTRIASPFIHYAMNKAAIDTLGHTLANAVGPRGITVNTIAAGVIDTDMGSWARSSPNLEQRIKSSIALGRLGQPADIADIVAFLVSTDARWITGVTLDASGGQWLGPPAA
jgi:NAD(P)-dependent dehydrogenase (short-subunit alcohol dehydrogenase family)